MGECVELVNYTKKQRIGDHLPFATPGEWLGHPVARLVTTRYLLKNRTDDIRFTGDYQDESAYLAILKFADVTDRVVQEMLDEGFVIDCGMCWQDEEDPSLYIRDIRLKPLSSEKEHD